MTVYLDTSSFIKLFVEEAGSDTVRVLASDALVVTSVVAYAEARAALARRRREAAIGSVAFAAAKRAFDTWWPTVVAIEVSSDLARTAGDIAERFRLRGFDSVHLATYTAVAAQRGLDAVSFSSFDDALNRAADTWRRQARRSSVSRRRARS